jgi:pyruvate dehydrogenase E2 component (dihydrolipoamide acetyltransferase)
VTDYRMPSLGADMEDGRVVEWFVRPGDAVHRGDVVGVVDTAKGAIEIEIWLDGVVEEIVVGPGTKVPVGAVLLRLRSMEEKALAAAEPPREPPVPAEPPARSAPPSTVGAAPAESPESAAAVPAAREPVTPPAGPRASPAARREARRRGIDLEGVRGSGPAGAIVLGDLTPPGRGEPEAEAHVADRLTAMRKAIAAAMARSKREIPHYYLATATSLRAALAWLERRNSGRRPEGRILPVTLFVKAVARAAREFPEFSGHWVEDTLRPSEAVHVGLGISLRGGGLVAPAIRDADRRSLEELGAAVTDLVQRAREGRLRSSEMTEATLTVTSLGDRGVETVFGVIYPPQVALVGFGRIVERPRAGREGVEVVPVVDITLSGDHRATDGHRGGLFLQDIADRLQRPEDL